MLRYQPALAIFATTLFLSACQTPSPVAQIAETERPRLEPPEKRCPGSVVPDDAQLAARLRISVEWLERMKEVRKLTSAQICGLNEIRLARALERSDPLAPSHGSEALAWRALAERDEYGEIRPDGRTIASAQRSALVRPTRTLSQSASDVEQPIAGIAPNRWTALGPGNIGGRIRSMVIHPANPQKMWVGSVSGGIWVTSDGGASWSPVNDVLPSLTISALAMDPTNANVMYAGTGEGVYFNITPDSVQGIGVYKSIDGGTTWNRLAQTNPAVDSGWMFVNRIAVHPTNGNIVVAASTAGIYRSTDGGANWQRALSAFGVSDVRFNPADGTKAIAGARGGVYVSTNAGATWTFVPVGSGGGRTETAYAPSNPGIVYASIDAQGGQVYRSTNGGVNWTLMSTPSHLSSQGGWNNTIWVAPNDPNLVVIGGIGLYRSTNGGASFTDIGSARPGGPTQGVHNDQHAIVHDPGYNGTNRRVYAANDGGVYRANDISTVSNTAADAWVNLNNGLAITQFYSGAGRPGGTLLGGTQDNGVLYNVGGGNWILVVGGDGGFVALDPVNTYAFSETIYLGLWRSPDGINNWQPMCSGLLDSNCHFRRTNFIAPFILDPNNSSRLLAGGQSLWRSDDAKAPTPSWSAIKNPAPSLSNISAIAVAQGNPDVIWVGHNSGEVYKTVNGTAASPTWTLVSGPLPFRYVTRIVIDKSAHDTVYVTFGGYTSGNVWKTTNAGTTWTDVHGALPQAPIRSITRHPSKPAWIYVGTEVGVFSSEDAGATWSTTSDAPANVSVDELFWLDSATLVAATHGRGMFSVVALSSPVRGDFNGDGRADILWRHASTGENYLYPMNGRQILAGEGYLRTVADLNWKIAGIGDFDGDGKADILWRNSSTGENYIYLMDGTTIVGEGYIRTVADQNWQVAGIGDFDGDGKADIVWRNSATGENYIYPMDRLSIKASEGYFRTVADQNWKIVGVGDFDGDTKADILWRNSVSGQNYIYPMNGTAIKSNEGFVRTVADLNWTVAGVGDLDGDGKADIVWRNRSTGENYLYPMEGTTIKPSEAYFRTVADPNWQIAALGDYDGDGKSDLVWRNSPTGENYLYPMDGSTIKPGEGYFRTVADVRWQIQKPR